MGHLEAHMKTVGLVPLDDYYRAHPLEEMGQRAADFCADIRRRRTVRDFSEWPVPREIIEDCLHAASAAPSGAHM